MLEIVGAVLSATTNPFDAPVKASPVRVAVTVYMPPAVVPVILQPAKVATPAVAVTVVTVQESEPAPGPLDFANVTEPVSLVTVLPYESCTVTTGWVARAVPMATPPTGWVVNTSLFAAPAVITTLLEAPVEVEPGTRRDERVRPSRGRARDLTARERRHARNPTGKPSWTCTQRNRPPDPSRSRAQRSRCSDVTVS